MANRNKYKIIDERDEWEGLAPSGTAITPELPHSASVCATGFRLLDLEISFEEWSEIGLKLSTMQLGLQWAIGDWWAYGYREYGDRRAIDVVKKLPYTFQSLMNIGSVARRVPPSLRNEALSFSHHTAVAPLEHEDQKQLLERAAEEKWSVKKLRDAIKRTTQEENEPDSDPKKWASYVIGCARRPCSLRSDPKTSLLEKLDENLLDELAKASANAAETWAELAQAAKGVQRVKYEQRPKRKRKRERERITHEEEPVG